MTVVRPIAPLPLRFDDAGLVPAVIQDADRDDVLMVGFMNEAALAETRASGRVHFWSRSRTKLWRKGETSGHEQVVESISVNCEQNSLLIRVHQIGAVCHDGYDSCYYRQLEPDNELRVTRQRVFDPADVYQGEGRSGPVDLTRSLLAAYTLLRDNDLSADSETSRRLHASDDTVTSRIGDELDELVGVLNGTHRHVDVTQDIGLEVSQVIYWIILACLRRDLGWSDLRPDRALATTDQSLTRETLAALVTADASGWRRAIPDDERFAPRCHATLSLLGQACLIAGLSPWDILAADLDKLLAKPYLNLVKNAPARSLDDATHAGHQADEPSGPIASIDPEGNGAGT